MATRTIVKCENCGQSVKWDEPTAPVCVRDGEQHVLHDMRLLINGQSVQLADSEITMHYDGADSLDDVFDARLDVRERLEVVIGERDLPHVRAALPEAPDGD